MIMWLWDMIVGRRGCEHVWSTEDSYELSRTSDGAAVGIIKHLKCTKCGDWKRVQL